MRLCIALILCASVACGQSLTGKENGLVAYYPLYGNTNNLAIGGLQGVSRNSSIGNFTNSPVEIDSKSAYMNSAKNFYTAETNLLHNADGMTFSVFVYQAIPRVRAGIFFSRPSVGPLLGIACGSVDPNGIVMLIPGFAGVGIMQAGVNLSNSWTHIAGTYDRRTGTTRGYKNGIMMSSINYIPCAITNLGYFGIGVDDFDTINRAFAGYMHDVSIWNRALSPAEVRALASNKPLPVSGGNSYQQQNRYGAQR